MTAGTCSATAPVTAEPGHLWLVVVVPPEGPGAVLGRWTDRAKAERECLRWIDLESDRAKGGTA